MVGVRGFEPRELAKGNPETLVYRADHALQSKPIFVPLDAAATEAQQVEALQH